MEENPVSPGKKLNCAVPGCTTVVLSSPIVKWFPFPDQNSLTSFNRDGKTVYYSTRRLWIERLGLVDKWLDKNAVACTLHFKEQDFTVTEEGGAILKDDAVPFSHTETSDKQTQGNENVIETVEKSDYEDDDVEIIEPPREIITLDDDDEEECQKEATPLEESASSGSDSVENTKDDVQHSSEEKQDKNTNLAVTYSSPKGVAHSKKGVVNDQPNPTKTNDTPAVNNSSVLPTKNGIVDTMNLSQNTMAKGSTLKEPVLPTVSINGDKVYVNVLKPVPTPAARGKARESPTYKFINVPEIRKMIIPKTAPETLKAQLADIPTVKATELTKQQIANLVKEKQVTLNKAKSKQISILKPLTPNTKLIKMLQIPSGLTPTKESEDNPKNSNMVNGKTDQTDEDGAPKFGLLLQALSRTCDIPKKKGSQSPKVVKEKVSKRSYKKRKVIELKKKEEIKQEETFKYVDIDEIMKNEKDDQDGPADVFRKETREISTQTDEGTVESHVGFFEMFNFIKKHMIDFQFNAMGLPYTLKDCSLHFVPKGHHQGCDKKVAIVSNTTLSSTDSHLLRAMQISIGLSKPKPPEDTVQYTKKVDYKSESISRIENEIVEKPKKTKKTKVKNVNNQPQQTVEDKTEKNENFGYMSIERDKKIILLPVLLDKPKKKYQREAGASKVSIGNKVVEVNTKIADETTKIADKTTKIADITTKIADITTKIADKTTAIADKTTAIADKTTALADKTTAIADKTTTIADKTTTIADKTAKITEEESSLERRKIIKKKKILIKSSLARSRKFLRLPMSQMNPTIAGRLNLDRNRVKKSKHLIYPNDRKKRELENGENEEEKQTDKDESIVSTSTDKDSLLDGIEQANTSEDNSPKKIISRTRGKKKDYRTLSNNGTTEVLKTTPIKRKKPSNNSAKLKKGKYSDKVGAIESFLEVVLEPENNEYDQNLNGGEKEANEGDNVDPFAD